MLTPSQLVAALAQWGTLLALAASIGALALDLLVLPHDVADDEPVRRRLRRWELIGLVALLLTTAADLVVRAQTMGGGSAAAALSALPVVLTRTHFGKVWVPRLAGIGLAFLLALAPRRAVRSPALLLVAGVALTTSLTGHAADWGDLSLSVLVDWGHVTAAAMWTGGLAVLALSVLGRRAAWPPALLTATVRRFSRLAGACLLVVVGSGAYNAWLQVGAWTPLWTSAYGRVLLVKLAIALGLVGLGAVNHYAILPRLDPSRRTSGPGARLARRARLVLCGPSQGGQGALAFRLSANVGREAFLAALVLACTAVLGESTPARHAEHAELLARIGGGQAPVRISEEALHDYGGVPKGWMFTPPDGDPDRGRQIFIRLGCFACHTVKGEGFPPPTGHGPDLTDMGEHHPAGYLAESIVNPNAVIVEGPGYTGPDGLSIMPDYRKYLTVSDLIDLVAYIKSH